LSGSGGADTRDATPSDDVRGTSDAPPAGDVLDVVLGDAGPPGMPPSPMFEGATAARLVARTCPYCRFPFAEGTGAVVCSACGTPHHSDCWRENGGCTTYGCREAPGPEPGARHGTAAPAPRVRLSGRAIQLPRLGGKGWLPVRLGRREEDISRAAEWAALFAFCGGLGALHPFLSPLLLLSVIGIRQGFAALRLMDEAGERSHASRGPARLAVIVGVAWIVLAVANYCVIFSS